MFVRKIKDAFSEDSEDVYSKAQECVFRGA